MQQILARSHRYKEVSLLLEHGFSSFPIDSEEGYIHFSGISKSFIQEKLNQGGDFRFKLGIQDRTSIYARFGGAAAREFETGFSRQVMSGEVIGKAGKSGLVLWLKIHLSEVPKKARSFVREYAGPMIYRDVLKLSWEDLTAAGYDISAVKTDID